MPCNCSEILISAYFCVMKIEAGTLDEYILAVDEERREAVRKLIGVIRKNIPDGFEEAMGYGMPGWVVPHSVFPDGYHCNPAQPLPFGGLAAQKNFIAVYHMGIYSDPALLEWFVSEHEKRVPGKLDMGKSCIRYKKPELIPFDLIGELFSKLSTQEWITIYRENLQKSSAGKKRPVKKQ